MRTMILGACVLSAAAIILAGCGQSDDGGDGTALLLLLSSNDAVAQMSQSSLEAVSDGMSDINNSGAADISYRMPCPAGWPGQRNIRERLMAVEGRILKAMSAEAATVSCPGGGTVDVTDIGTTWGDTDATSFYVARTFNDCRGPYGFVSVSGGALLRWSNMNTGTGTDKLAAGSVLDQAPVSKRFTRVSTGDYITTTGNGVTITHGVLTGDIAHTVNWTAVGPTTRSFTMTTDLTRRGYRASGVRLFEHNLTTPSPLNVTVDMSAETRTLSGAVEVEHVLMGMTVTTTFTNLVVPIDDCVPASGGATIVISGVAGDGSGTITYNGDGTANYTYAYTTPQGRTRSGSGTFVVTGCQ